MTNKAYATQRRALIEKLLAGMPYTSQSAKYQELERDLSKLKYDTLYLLRLTQNKKEA